MECRTEFPQSPFDHRRSRYRNGLLRGAFISAISTCELRALGEKIVDRLLYQPGVCYSGSTIKYQHVENIAVEYCHDRQSMKSVHGMSLNVLLDVAA